MNIQPHKVLTFDGQAAVRVGNLQIDRAQPRPAQQQAFDSPPERFAFGIDGRAVRLDVLGDLQPAALRWRCWLPGNPSDRGSARYAGPNPAGRSARPVVKHLTGRSRATHSNTSFLKRAVRGASKVDESLTEGVSSCCRAPGKGRASAVAKQSGCPGSWPACRGIESYGVAVATGNPGTGCQTPSYVGANESVTCCTIWPLRSMRKRLRTRPFWSDVTSSRLPSGEKRGLK